jgi:hypothetical protein
LLKELVHYSTSNPLVKLPSLLLKVAQLLALASTLEASNQATQTHGKNSARMKTLMNADTPSMLGPLAVEHQEMFSAPSTSSLLENKSSQLRSSNLSLSSMLPTAPTLRQTQPRQSINQKHGMSPVP